MSRIDDIAAEIHAEISAKRKAERKAEREHAISMAKMRASVKAHKAEQAEAARQARNQRRIQEALDEAAQLASTASESEADTETGATVEDVLAAPRAKLKGLTARYPLFGEKGVELREAADILNVSESDVQGLLDSGELEPFVIVSKTRKMDENGIILPREQKVYPHLVSLESLRAHIDA